MSESSSPSMVYGLYSILDQQGFITCLCSVTNTVDIYTVNGEFVTSYTNEHNISTIQYTHDGLCIMIGTTIGYLILLTNTGEEIGILDYTIHGGITCICDDANMYVTYLGTDKGVLLALSDTEATNYFKYTM